ncbi:MAG TPA: nucleotidyl transferase AbiEii/AbiGii toxin family protein [Smithella sp.]|jgi:predicted nucleotidyltransferase component of viral defense system|nr:nucleotidyl transferase AbiEii/AbiGii toxin family protein [Smithellaceae bacterium]HPC08734.1 nucleotidyl transferase AbiEii/AbiGii toxin family protein [Smithella sp.]HPN87285.1 nucleotidyl transferase AbiEii/AbiGii toxin family protein [Smithella sp.]HQN70977.1 nucleotidyl transferase AbiEii/AbiGii toxin family protein [Smithella sp.]HQP41456.1 nucleotidyl transferase AbiEii/AbiGii toxin family protein [Smithella sp.]
MHSAVADMLKAYDCRTADDYRHALNEIVQELALLGLYRGGFFNHAAFYGGTALRIFYGLDRFSEDLDFSLTKSNKKFDLSSFTQVVQDELGAYGLEMTVKEKIKQNDSPVKSAFIKGGTQIHIVKIASIEQPVAGINPHEQLRIKLEVDTQPPPCATFEMKYQLRPVPYSVRLYAPSSLFAGKIHALLCRSWKTRVKGRDFYDYVWFLSRSIPVNLAHLAERMKQTGHLSAAAALTEKDLQGLLHKRFASVDFEQARKDVLPFIKNRDTVKLWSADFFSTITDDKLKIEKAK